MKLYDFFLHNNDSSSYFAYKIIKVKQLYKMS